MTDSNSTVLIEELPANQGTIGTLTLNAPKSLNSLSLEMIRALSTQLLAWQDNDDIACVVLSGNGDKAFCAGGDVQKLYESAIDKPGGPCEYAEKFFFEEYQLNYLIHTYSKPIICLGHGIVMGGGLGLMAGASHKIVSERSRIAMPEISIGLFPDVGGTYFLNKMPYGLGIFFALTGASINACDALTLGLADFFIAQADATKLIETLCQHAWPHDQTLLHSHVDDVLTEFALTSKQIEQHVSSELAPYQADIEAACQTSGLGDIISALNTLEHDSKWLNKAITALNHGSPLSALLIFEQLRRHRYTNLRDAFLSELILATNMVRFPDFAEGVRALLIDKDLSPKWHYSQFSHVTASELEAFFTAPWAKNPLEEKLN